MGFLVSSSAISVKNVGNHQGYFDIWHCRSEQLYETVIVPLSQFLPRNAYSYNISFPLYFALNDWLYVKERIYLLSSRGPDIVTFLLFDIPSLWITANIWYFVYSAYLKILFYAFCFYTTGRLLVSFSASELYHKILFSSYWIYSWLVCTSPNFFCTLFIFVNSCF